LGFGGGFSEEVAYAQRLLWPIAGRRAPGRGGLLRSPDSLGRAIDIGGLGGFDRAIDNDVFVRGYADPLWGTCLVSQGPVKFRPVGILNRHLMTKN
jgi:hypothetical protein